MAHLGKLCLISTLSYDRIALSQEKSRRLNTGIYVLVA